VGFVLFRCPIVAPFPIGAVDIWDDLDVPRQEKKLFPHFGEAGTAIFLIQEIKYGGHNSHSPSFDRWRECCP
jgi:hypothetical protein